MSTPLHDLSEREWHERCAVQLRPMNDPQPGYFRVRIVARGPWLPARIWEYTPRVAGGPHLAAHIGGLNCEVEQVWLHGREITAELYNELMRSPPAEPLQPVSRRRTMETVQ